jgi:hypothetical protein
MNEENMKCGKLYTDVNDDGPLKFNIKWAEP